MTGCEISDVLCDYINGRLSREEINTVLNHLAKCQCCRAETAALIRIRNALQSGMSPVPAEVCNTAFDKIPDGGFIENPVSFAYESIYYSVKIIKQTIRLAAQAI